MQTKKAVHWWQRSVIYEIYPRSFQDTSGNGVGDLAGIIQRLDYLNDGTVDSLGIDAIWITPFYPSPMADFGYDVADYCDVDPLFGNMDTFDRLVTAAHEREIKIVIDWVPNHTSDQHPWFIESRSSRDDPKRHWYIWRDPKLDGSRPNNWGSFFGGPAWTFDKKTGQYYLHQFAPQQPELNWRNPEMREAMLDTLRFWLDRGVDGFRIDVVGLLIKDEQLRDNPPKPDASADLPRDDIYNRLQPVYNLDQDEVHQIIREIRRVLDGYDRERMAMGELWFELPRWVKYYGQNDDGLHLPINFRLIHRPWQAVAMRRSVEELEATLPDFAWPNYVLASHDFRRLASRLGSQEKARLAAMMLLTLRGTPTIYYGDELGLEDGVISPEKIQDPRGLNLGPEQTRDVARTPMQWDDGPHAGFSTVDPWLPVSDDYTARNVAAQSQQPTSILNLYRRLLWYRRSTPALAWGSYRPLDVVDNCFVYLRQEEDERRLIALNFNYKASRVSISGDETGEVVISTYLDREERVKLSELMLRPHEGVIIELF